VRSYRSCSATTEAARHVRAIWVLHILLFDKTWRQLRSSQCILYERCCVDSYQPYLILLVISVFVVRCLCMGDLSESRTSRISSAPKAYKSHMWGGISLRSIRQFNTVEIIIPTCLAPHEIWTLCAVLTPEVTSTGCTIEKYPFRHRVVTVCLGIRIDC